MISGQKIILLFSKYPVPGKSKTRLIPAIGKYAAAELQKKMTEDIVTKLEKYRLKTHVPYVIYHHGGNEKTLQRWLGEKHEYRSQASGNIGSKMNSALAEYLEQYSSILLIGADCPMIDHSIFTHAFTILEKKQIVLGPCFDGGYYLVGIQGNLLPEKVKHLFEGVTWSSNTVLATTLKNIEKDDLSYGLTTRLHDIDTPEDLRHIDYYSYT